MTDIAIYIDGNKHVLGPRKTDVAVCGCDGECEWCLGTGWLTPRVKQARDALDVLSVVGKRGAKAGKELRMATSEEINSMTVKLEAIPLFLSKEELKRYQQEHIEPLIVEVDDE